MVLTTTPVTPKFNLRQAIPTFNIPTVAAFLTSVTRVNKIKLHAFDFGFATNKCLDSTANIREVFTNQHDTGQNKLNQTLVQYAVQSCAICQAVFPSMFARKIERLRQHRGRFHVGWKLDTNRCLHKKIVPSHRRDIICKLQRLCIDIDALIPPYTASLLLGS
jgi:hypothetical protein